MSQPRDTLTRALALGLGLVVVLAGGGWFVFERFLVEPPGPTSIAQAPPLEPSQPVPAVVPEVSTLVVGVVGVVERTRGADWEAVNVGDVLAPDESIRTGAGSRADLQVGDEESRLSIEENSEVRVGEVTRAAHDFRLARGRIAVDFRGQDSQQVLRVQSGSGTVAETRQARFTMLRSGATVAVATRVGSVRLSSAGETVEVGAGQQSVVFDGAKPLAVQPIPMEVLLKVAAKAAADDSLCVVLSGQVRPGSEVFVGDEPAAVSREGAFLANVARQEGLARVRVVAREPGGAKKELLLACRPPARASPKKAQVKFRWEETP